MYNNEERSMIVRFYYSNGSSIIATQRAFRKHFNTRKAPSRRAIKNMVQRFEEHGSVNDLPRTGRPRTVTSDENAQRVKDSIDKNDKISIRKRAKELCIPRASLRRILAQELHLFPYKIQLTHKFEVSDRKQRLKCANTLQNLMIHDSNFTNKLIMSDEANFYLNGLVKKHNCRIWGTENPRIISEKQFQTEKVIVWCGITSRKIIGPYFFKNEESTNINGEEYREMIDNYLVPELVNTIGMWFQQDEATAHITMRTINLLKTIFSNRIISRNSEISWPLRSPDLSAVDFFLWGYLKERVYKDKPKTLEELKNNIQNEINEINETKQDTLKKVMKNVIERAQLCEQSKGSHLKDIIIQT
uniref:DUF4817 domain-containing protein n=1 Tax=Strongyloides papillosus TaxID=174720 RepID=A0A0N5C9I2_STREA